MHRIASPDHVTLHPHCGVANCLTQKVKHFEGRGSTSEEEEDITNKHSELNPNRFPNKKSSHKLLVRSDNHYGDVAGGISAYAEDSIIFSEHMTNQSE